MPFPHMNPQEQGGGNHHAQPHRVKPVTSTGPIYGERNEGKAMHQAGVALLTEGKTPVYSGPPQDVQL